jgi:hypothetical protein
MGLLTRRSYVKVGVHLLSVRNPIARLLRRRLTTPQSRIGLPDFHPLRA